MVLRQFIWLLIIIPTLTSAQDRRPMNGVRGHTIPSADVMLSFVQPGLVANIDFKEGDKVTQNQMVAKLDSTVEEAQVEQLRAESENITRINAGSASLDQKRVDLEKIQKAASRGAATALEVQHSQLEVKIAELSLALAQFEHEQAKRKYAEGLVRLDRMKIKSPIKGIVEEVHVEKGESVNALDDVIRLVSIDPLWIDALMPLAEAAKMKAGQGIRVQYSTAPTMTVVSKVLHVASVADAASGKIKVRIELPNPSNRPAGEFVWIIPGPITP